MYKWTAFPFIRLALCLSAGIVVREHYPEYWQISFPLSIAILTTIILSISIIKSPVYKGFVLLGIIFYLGGMLNQMANESADPLHYVHHQKVDGFVGVITSDNTERTNHHRYEMEIKLLHKQDSTFQAKGKIYFYVNKKSSPNSEYEYGDVLSVRKGYFSVAPPKNPHEFDYQAYLKKHNIFSHAFVSKEDITKIENDPPNPLLNWALAIRSESKLMIANFIPDQREKAILTALLLGIKDYLDNEIQTAYASAGAMHVLAVSGLHVGIVILIISLLFGKWKETKSGKIIYTLSTIMIIWVYALVTGFSPSVMRAATMFTVILLSSGFSKRANIYNSLGIAATVLIIYNPYIIYAVGFQLSFAAVLGIVILHPKIYRLTEFNSSILDYIWSITCVSISAQVATFPLSMLYFHQFPTYFLISNLVVIPSAAVMLGAGILMLVGGSISGLIGECVGFLLKWFAWCVNEIILFLQHLPYPIFDWLYFDALDTALVYLMLLFLILTFSKYSFESAVFTFIATMILIGWQHHKQIEQLSQKKIIFYEIDDVIAIDLIDGRRAQLLIDNHSMGGTEVVSFQIDPNRLANGLPKSSQTWKTFYKSNLVENRDHFDLLNWNDINIAIFKNMDTMKVVDSIRADLVYFKNPKSMVRAISNKTEVILGTGFSYYQTQSALSDFKKRNIVAHSLTLDGFRELDLTIGARPH
ncbi:MAG: ComEC family competence protein [Cyclobacteriaceae bacterium]